MLTKGSNAEILLLLVGCMLGSGMAHAQDDWLAIDQSVRENFDLGANEVSYDTMYAALFAPLGLLATREGGEDRAKFYGGAIATNLATNFAVKFAVKRPRPYNHNPHAAARSYAEQNPTRRYLSFYSGHSSTSFVGGIAGSMMVRDFWSNPVHRDAFWFFQYSMASASAFMRVAAGVHYYTDITVGALAGSAIGLIAANLAEVDMHLQPGEYVGLVSGLVVGGFLAFHADFSDALVFEPAVFRSGHSALKMKWSFP